MIRKLLDYYRQFEELSPDEISRELIEKRHAERAQALTEVPPLDLATPAWHEPPDAEAVNAATYALRRAVNAYPDPTPLIEAIAARHGVEREHVVAGHGAGELLRAAFRPLRGAEVAVAWPGWGYMPRLLNEAGATPVAVEPDVEELVAAPAQAVVVCTPNDPTGAEIDVAALAERLDPATWLIVDAALAEFAPPRDDVVERERTIVVRSFSKAHAMAGLRGGYALGHDVAALAPVAGVSAPAQAAMLWALADGDAIVARRRAAAARERERLADALRDTPFSFPAGHGPLIWLHSTEHDGAAIAAGLAAQRIYVTPGGAWGDDTHVRIALRDGAATDRLSAALSEL
ncbi:MAG TPA: aminotransferase class I/II-fold pyridoxal phosphate-dependent enzyme [Solirubrobacteraceae bacterium]|nr:aminotransferase class I/II-fold pyridoxal phosphate-dependent enzyme [Solirubrobacteraceae bacterium]